MQLLRKLVILQLQHSNTSDPRLGIRLTQTPSGILQKYNIDIGQPLITFSLANIFLNCVSKFYASNQINLYFFCLHFWNVHTRYWALSDEMRMSAERKIYILPMWMNYFLFNDIIENSHKFKFDIVFVN